MPKNEPTYQATFTESERQLLVDVLLDQFGQHQGQLRSARGTQLRLHRKHANSVWLLVERMKFATQVEAKVEVDNKDYSQIPHKYIEKAVGGMVFCERCGLRKASTLHNLDV